MSMLSSLLFGSKPEDELPPKEEESTKKRASASKSRGGKVAVKSTRRSPAPAAEAAVDPVWEVKEVQSYYHEVMVLLKNVTPADGSDLDPEIKTAMLTEFSRAFVPKLYEKVQSAKKSEEKIDFVPDFDESSCIACREPYSDEVLKVTMLSCGHSICTTCFYGYSKAKVEENEIHPWLVCPGEKCTRFVHSENLLQLSDLAGLELLLLLAKTYMSKVAVRFSDLVACTKTKDCKGFLLAEGEKPVSKVCEVCKEAQDVAKAKVELDSEFEKMIKDGIIRGCPKCNAYQMKDKGMCNVMHCEACGIYWNWRDRSIGSSYKEMKDIARASGTMWEPGELDYQRWLEKNDIEEFKRLLARNGIKYDPKFVRGRT